MKASRATAPARAARRLRDMVSRGTSGAPESFDDRVVWLLGSPRSGSTWLLQLLGDHRAIVPINEPLIGWYLGPFMSDLPAMSARSLTLEDFTMRRIHREKRPHFFAEEFSDVWLPGLSRLLRDRFHAQAVRYPADVALGESFVVVKEPNGSQSADLLMRAMPRSRLLFLLRDGRDVVDSELAANLKGSWVASQFPGSAGVPEAERLEFVVQSARKWLWRTEVVQEAFAAHDGHKLLLKYEDLRRDPVEHLGALFSWLGVPIGDAELAALIDRHAFENLPEEKRGPDQFYRAASPGQWAENLLPAEQASLEEEIGPKLRELGYE